MEHPNRQGNPNWKPGVSANPNGRPKGSKNKTTEAIRDAYQDLIEGNLANITTWLEKVAKDDPSKALDFMLRLSPFVLPKLQANDITSAGEPFKIILPKKPDEDDD